jgi:glycine/D-amino acid oxidase-like deaminating enzyme
MDFRGEHSHPIGQVVAVDVLASLATAKPEPYWLDSPSRPAARPRLDHDVTCDLAIVGGGFTGLWTALLAKEADPDRDVVLVEGGQLAWAASGRNGGFCAASLTHGEANGRRRFGAEYERLAELGLQNLDEIQATVERYAIDCNFERSGELSVATRAYQVDELRAATGQFLDRDEIRAQVNSPTYLAGSWSPDTTAMIEPAALAWGLADRAERLGVRIYERTPVTRLRTGADGVELRSDVATVRADRVALATNAFVPLVRRIKLHTVPVWDYVLVTEPLTPGQLESIGWSGRQGIGDSGNQFHYYRRTRDDRILWGGYDAIYRFGRRLRPGDDQRAETFRLLARHFFTTFPQLAGLRFSHKWGGAIDTCTRFCAFYGTAHSGRVAYATGYTGLGVGASRFGAQVMLDLVDGRDTERTRLQMVRTTPLPFPPEPFAYLGVQATRWSLAHADANDGRRNLWLRTLDRLGLGFDS